MSREALVQICRRLDGLPLALELAAARLRSMSLGDLSRRLGDGSGTVSGSGLADNESDALSVAFATSYRLSDREQTLFPIAIFARGWTLEAAQAVAGDNAAGNAVARDNVAGETVAADNVAGDDDAGNPVARDSARSMIDLFAQLVDRSVVVPPAAEGNGAAPRPARHPRHHAAEPERLS